MSPSDARVAAQTNRLATTTSPYLQQHAHNPVDWWPWCEEALALAREQDRPILLSIGYAACHWCHVMAHESFEDPATAALMNRLFVNIKVDREERPDLDRLHQTAHQLLTQRAGGWPLTVFLTPDDHRPFFAGTYFPPEPRHGMPSFAQLLASVERAYREQRDAIRSQNAALMDAMAKLEPTMGQSLPEAALLDAAVTQLAEVFDTEHGGFGAAPKFPHAPDLEFLLRRHAAGAAGVGSVPGPLRMATLSLERMVRGGLLDQLGGGFYRYSVDARWMIPHFEKMLYDNGPLLALCSDAYATSGEPIFRHAAEATADWVMREMQSPEGGYYSSLDADSEGHEGTFYLWDRDEVRALLSPAEDAPFAAVYGLDQPAGFEGRWHLHGRRSPQAVAGGLGLGEAQVDALLASARATLFAARERRVRPGCDDKVLTAWNALMVKGMARAARVFDRPDYLESAEQALRFIRATLWRQGRLRATYRDGIAHLNAYLDDYANLIDALLELLQTRWSGDRLDFAIDLAEVLLEQFQDPEQGGFWLTGHDHEPLIHRPKPLADESMPSGNGVAAFALQRLGHLIGEPRYLNAAAGALKLAAASMRRMPYAHAMLLMALEEHLQPPEVMVIRASDDRLETWQRQAQQGYRPHRLVLAIPASQTRLPGTLAAMRAGDRPCIYRCRGTHCEPPVGSLAELA
ncbi:thioredoxin domain-containing protein [Thiocystis violacea]|uniref:thioredoxin domain-containing protein n=1 Tax=Thiocystis violacea TaxID=13725 RepID=UPI0019039490|nr:thioredoxin domain-containing protein [Thiocystis violacea]MBK1724666.1 thioredoxin domain-containing protein [Thiocystis violacea]